VDGRPDGPSTWAPGEETRTTGPDASAVGLLATLNRSSGRIHARTVPGRRPADDPLAGMPAVALHVAPAPESVPAPALGGPPLESPSRAGFSPDGVWWWDGRRWSPTGTLDPRAPEAAPRRRRPPAALVWAGVVALTFGVLTAAAVPVLWDDRSQVADQVLQEALLHAAQAQQQHLVDHGTYTASDRVLATYAADAPGGQPAVRVEIHGADAMTFCLSAAVADGAPTLWLSELGYVTSQPCA
jgi:hypothetical protein